MVLTANRLNCRILAFIFYPTMSGNFSFSKIVLTGLAAGVFLSASCQTGHKATASKSVIRQEICAENWLNFPDQPHPMWEEVTTSIDFQERQAPVVPRKYKAYRINADTLKAFFAAIQSGRNEIGMVVPVTGSNCESFNLRRSGTMSAELQKKYPDIISLQGNGATNKSADLRLDWDGSLLKGQVIYNSTIYFITPFTTAQGLIYVFYDKKDTNEVKNPFEKAPENIPAQESNKTIKYDR